MTHEIKLTPSSRNFSKKCHLITLKLSLYVLQEQELENYLVSRTPSTKYVTSIREDYMAQNYIHG